MKTIMVEIRNNIAMSLLRNLESMQILRVVEDKTVTGNRSFPKSSQDFCRKTGQMSFKKN
jgi:hypothetical protein